MRELVLLDAHEMMKNQIVFVVDGTDKRASLLALFLSYKGQIR